jgi:hypothetical protein
MQDIQNIPNPDINSTQRQDDFGIHSDIERENESNNSDVENIPLPPTEPKPAPVEEPPEETDNARIEEPGRKPTQIV